LGEKEFNVILEKKANEWKAYVGKKTFAFPLLEPRGKNHWFFSCDNRFFLIPTQCQPNQITFWLQGAKSIAHVETGGAGLKPAPANEFKGPHTLKSVMPGLIKQIKVKVRERVEKGQGLIVLEAMKMENEIVAPQQGRVEAILVKKNQSVEAQAPLLRLTPR